MPNDPYAPQPLPSQGPPGLRPPADVGGAPGRTARLRYRCSSGSATAARGCSGTPSSPTVVAALPPEDQPEQGPRKELPPQFRRQLVDYVTTEPPGTIIIDTPNTYLYLVLGQRKAMRYGIGVGREGFTWAGTERISRMKEWPDWFPPKEMIDRQPYLPRFMAGGETNPLGARALYLGNTLYRIHGTNQPSTIGSFVSSGLHPADQRGHRGPLRSGAGRHSGRGAARVHAGYGGVTRPDEPLTHNSGQILLRQFLGPAREGRPICCDLFFTLAFQRLS